MHRIFVGTGAEVRRLLMMLAVTLFAACSVTPYEVNGTAANPEADEVPPPPPSSTLAVDNIQVDAPAPKGGKGQSGDGEGQMGHGSMKGMSRMDGGVR